MKFFQRYSGWIQGLGWVVFMSLPLLSMPGYFWNSTDLLSLAMGQLSTGLLLIVYFYYNLNRLTPALLQKGGSGRFWLVISGMLLAVLLVKALNYYVFPPFQFAAFPPPPPPGSLPGAGRPGLAFHPAPPGPWPGLTGTFLAFSFVMLVSSLMALFRHNIRSEEERQQMALEKISAELAMLKLQVSPHFLFNTLNNIRWLARKKSEQTEPAVVKLAQLLRYMIYQAQQERVPLRQEVEHLQYYIDLQQMRLTDRHPVSFALAGDIDACQIEPLLFVPFVENAFKYGSAVAEGGAIRVRLSVTDKLLTFETHNPTALGSPSASPDESGIGVTNVRKRLALHYPDRHVLTVEEVDGQFNVRLLLDLHHE